MQTSRLSSDRIGSMRSIALSLALCAASSLATAQIAPARTWP